MIGAIYSTIIGLTIWVGLNYIVAKLTQKSK